MIEENVNKIFSNFLRTLNRPRGYKIDGNSLAENLDPKEIEKLVSLGILKPIIRVKKKDLLEQKRKKVIEIDEKSGKVQLADVRNPGTLLEEPLYKYSDYELKVDTFISILSELIAKKLQHRFKLYLASDKITVSSDYIKSNIIINKEKNSRKREFVFFFEFKQIYIPELLRDLAKNLELKTPILLISSTSSIIDIIQSFELVAVGALVYIITYEDLARLIEGDPEVIQDLVKWLNYVFDILEIEDNVLSTIKDEKFSELRGLLIKVDTNPKYLVTMLSLFKLAQKISGRTAWKLFEDLVGVTLSFLYGGEISQLGYRASFENVPDSIFIVRGSKPKPGQSEIELIGIVDAKSGALELNPTQVIKYDKYFDIIRRNPWIGSSSSSQLIILYFVTTSTCEEITRKYNQRCTDKGLKGFYNAIRDHLLANEYIAILPVESLLLLIDTYMSILRRMKLHRTLPGLHEFYRTVLRPDNEQIITRIADKFYCIDPQKLRNFIKSRLDEDVLTWLATRTKDT